MLWSCYTGYRNRVSILFQGKNLFTFSHNNRLLPSKAVGLTLAYSSSSAIKTPEQRKVDTKIVFKTLSVSQGLVKLRCSEFIAQTGSGLGLQAGVQSPARLSCSSDWPFSPKSSQLLFKEHETIA